MYLQHMFLSFMILIENKSSDLCLVNIFTIRYSADSAPRYDYYKIIILIDIIILNSCAQSVGCELIRNNDLRTFHKSI